MNVFWELKPDEEPLKPAGAAILKQRARQTSPKTMPALWGARKHAMRIRENYHRRDFGHMDVEITIDDPKYYTRPFSIKAQLNLIPDSDSLEYVCDNEKDRGHLATP